MVLELARRHPSRIAAVACIDGGFITLSRTFPDWETAARELAPPYFHKVLHTDLEGRGSESTTPTGRRAAFWASWPTSKWRRTERVRPHLKREYHFRLLREMWKHQPCDIAPSLQQPVLVVATTQTAAGRAAKRESVVPVRQTSSQGSGDLAGCSSRPACPVPSPDRRMARGTGARGVPMSAGRLILMGSGEVSNRLVAAHRLGIERAGAREAVVLDTPFGFQENASLLSERLTGFFRTSLAINSAVASYRSTSEGEVALERMLAAVRGSRYVFAGPGSPGYALATWRDTGLERALRNLLSEGATITLASAAALTAGAKTLPVYEIFKVGAGLEWLEGLNLTAHLGLEAVVIPHWNNTEGRDSTQAAATWAAVASSGFEPCCRREWG